MSERQEAQITPPHRTHDYQLIADVEVLKERTANIQKDIQKLSADLAIGLAGFASKAELKDVAADLESIRSWLNWGAKIVFGAVLAAVLGIVIVKGGVRI